MVDTTRDHLAVCWSREKSDGQARGERRLGRKWEAEAGLLRKTWSQLGEALERARSSMVLNQSLGILNFPWTTRNCTSGSVAFNFNFLYFQWPTPAGSWRHHLTMTGGHEESWPQGKGPGTEGSNNRGCYSGLHTWAKLTAAVRLSKVE